MLNNLDVKKCNKILSQSIKIWNLDILAKNLYHRYSKSNKIKNFKNSKLFNK